MSGSHTGPWWRPLSSPDTGDLNRRDTSRVYRKIEVSRGCGRVGYYSSVSPRAAFRPKQTRLRLFFPDFGSNRGTRERF